MPSPFPGMDPYLEDPDLWPDVHGTLLPLIREALKPDLPTGYAVRIDQYIYVQEDDSDERERRGRSDIFVTNGGGQARPAVTAELAPTERVMLPQLKKRRGNRYIKLVDSRRKKVVTVIELLSPANKDGGEGFEQYLAKRIEYFAAGVNLVEIDLLRAGSRLPMGDPRVAAGDYYILVTRAAEYPAADLWAFTVLNPIPPIPVPLKPEHGAITLDLRACLDRAYDGAGYADQIDYTHPAVPALRWYDAEWAADLLKKHAKKRKK